MLWLVNRMKQGKLTLLDAGDARSSRACDVVPAHDTHTAGSQYVTIENERDGKLAPRRRQLLRPRELHRRRRRRAVHPDRPRLRQLRALRPDAWRTCGSTSTRTYTRIIPFHEQRPLGASSRAASSTTRSTSPSCRWPRASRAGSSARWRAEPTPRSGMIGLGNMGGRIARRIRDAGLPVAGFDVSEEQARAGRRAGSRLDRRARRAGRRRAASRCPTAASSRPSSTATTACSARVARGRSSSI